MARPKGDRVILRPIVQTPGLNSLSLELRMFSPPDAGKLPIERLYFLLSEWTWGPGDIASSLRNAGLLPGGGSSSQEGVEAILAGPSLHLLLLRRVELKIIFMPK